MKDNQGRSKVFHSLRRVVVNELRKAGVSIPLIQANIGHEIEGLGVTEVYLDEIFTIEEKAIAIEKLKLTGIGWDHPNKLKI